MIDVLVIGSVNLDLSAAVSRLPEAGETVTGASLSRFPGGKGANQALAAKRLGADVRLIACVGDDAAAEEALALLREGDVDLFGVQRLDDQPTGIALISVAPSGENQIVVAPGANTAINPDALDVGKADALICQLEIPGTVVEKAAADFDGFFCANLAPAKEIDVAVMQRADLVVVNETCANLAPAKEIDVAVMQRADLVVVNETEAAWYGDSLTACGGLIAITYGSRGATLQMQGETIAEAKPPPVMQSIQSAPGIHLRRRLQSHWSRDSHRKTR
jgi:ribokinase